MSLLTEKKRTVIEGNIASATYFQLGSPTRLLGGLNYYKIVCVPVQPTLPFVYSVLIDSVSGLPVNLTNLFVAHVMFEAGPALVSSPTPASISLINSEQPDVSGNTHINTSIDYTLINDKYIYEYSDVDATGLETNYSYKYLALAVTTALPSSILSGSVTVTLVVATLPSAAAF